MKTFVKFSLLAILAMTLCVPMLAQGPVPPPGRTISWTTNLTPLVADGASGAARYTTFIPATAGKIQTRFSVECEYLTYPTAKTVLDVFIEMPAGPTPSDRKFVGRMQVENGSSALLLLTGNAPTITKGTKVIVAIHDGPALMVGTF